MTNESIFSTNGLYIPYVNVTLEQEWNIIGWFKPQETTAEALGQNISGCTVVITFDAPSQIFITHVVGTPHDNFIINRGMGLFIYTLDEGWWTGEG